MTDKALAQLRQIAFSASSRMLTAHCEMSVGGFDLLHRGGPSDEILEVLYDFWRDVRLGRCCEPALLGLGALRSAEEWANDRWGDMRRSDDAFEEMFSSLNLVGASVPVQVLVSLRDALVDSIIPGQWDRGEPVSWDGMIHVTRRANSVVASWPECLAFAFQFVSSPRSNKQAASLFVKYVSCLMYPTVDHPFLSKPIVLWDRYGASAGACWSPASAAALATHLKVQRVRRELHEVAPIVQAEWLAEIREMIEVQSCFGYEPRVESLLVNFTDDRPVGYWREEYGEK